MASDISLWIPEAPAHGPRKAVATRRSHKKSRLGCFTCKVRRVKCDETRPVCQNCSSRATKCEYDRKGRNHDKTGMLTPAASLHEERQRQSSPVLTSRDVLNDQLENVSFTTEATLGLDVFATSIANMTRTHATTRTSANTLPFLLHHFSTSAYTTLSSYTGQRIIKQQIPDLVMQFPFLLEAVLAFSASHMSYLKQGRKGPVPPSDNMGVVAAWHIVRALRGYGQEISDFRVRESSISSNIAKNAPQGQENRDRERKSMDALVAACLILTSLFYRVSWSDDQPQIWSSLWMPDKPKLAPASTQAMPPAALSPRSLGELAVLLNDTPPRLNNSSASQNLLSTNYNAAMRNVQPSCDWLTNVTGMSTILSLTRIHEHVPHSIWYPFFAEAKDQHGNSNSHFHPLTPAKMIHHSPQNSLPPRTSQPIHVPSSPPTAPTTATQSTHPPDPLPA